MNSLKQIKIESTANKKRQGELKGGGGGELTLNCPLHHIKSRAADEGKEAEGAGGGKDRRWGDEQSIHMILQHAWVHTPTRTLPAVLRHNHRYHMQPYNYHPSLHTQHATLQRKKKTCYRKDKSSFLYVLMCANTCS